MSKNTKLFVEEYIAEDDTKLLNEFIENSEDFSIEQRPDWYKKFPGKYFYIKSNNSIVAYVKTKEIKIGPLKFATINYAPGYHCQEDGIEIIRHVADYYKKKHFLYLSVQLGSPVSNITEYIERSINQFYNIKYFYKSGHARSTIRIPLNTELPEIMRSFRKGHKSDIKKAQKLLSVRPIENEIELKEYYSVFNKMSRIKKVYESSTYDEIKALFQYLKKMNIGFVLGVYNDKDVCVGGVVIVSNGKGMRYYQGASDPDIRNIPILHLAIYKSIEICKQQSKSYLDLWGYNIYAKKGDAISGINRFKKGFSSEITFFPKTMHFNLFPLGMYVFKLLARINSFIKTRR